MKIEKFNEFFDNDDLKARHEIEMLSGKLDLKQLVKNIHKNTPYDKVKNMINFMFPIFFKFELYDLVKNKNTVVFIFDNMVNSKDDDMINIHLDLRVRFEDNMYNVYSGNYVTINDKRVYDKEIFVEDTLTKEELFDFIKNKFLNELSYIEMIVLKKYDVKLFNNKSLKDAKIVPQVN